MNSIGPKEAFDRITNNLGFRPIAVSLYRVITSHDPIVVVENEQQVNWFKVFLRDIQNSVNLSAFTDKEQQRNGHHVVSMKTYKAKWQEFAGKEICLVLDEQATKNPGVDLMMETLIKKHARDVLKQYEEDTSSHYLTEIKQILQRVMKAVRKIHEKARSQKISDTKLKESEAVSILNTYLDKEIEKNLGFHLTQIISRS